MRLLFSIAVLCELEITIDSTHVLLPSFTRCRWLRDATTGNESGVNVKRAPTQPLFSQCLYHPFTAHTILFSLQLLLMFLSLFFCLTGKQTAKKKPKTKHTQTRRCPYLIILVVPNEVKFVSSCSRLPSFSLLLTHRA